MCFSSSQPAATPEPAPAPPAPAIPATQSAAAAAEPFQQIGFARKAENKLRYGKTTGPQGRRNDASPAASTTGDTGVGIKM